MYVALPFDVLRRKDGIFLEVDDGVDDDDGVVVDFLDLEFGVVVFGEEGEVIVISAASLDGVDDNTDATVVVVVAVVVAVVAGLLYVLSSDDNTTTSKTLLPSLVLGAGM